MASVVNFFDHYLEWHLQSLQIRNIDPFQDSKDCLRIDILGNSPCHLESW